MRYDQLRDEVAKRKPGWEYLQDVSFLYCALNIVAWLILSCEPKHSKCRYGNFEIHLFEKLKIEK